MWAAYFTPGRETNRATMPCRLTERRDLPGHPIPPMIPCPAGRAAADRATPNCENLSFPSVLVYARAFRREQQSHDTGKGEPVITSEGLVSITGNKPRLDATRRAGALNLLRALDHFEHGQANSIFPKRRAGSDGHRIRSHRRRHRGRDCRGGDEPRLAAAEHFQQRFRCDGAFRGHVRPQRQREHWNGGLQ